MRALSLLFPALLFFGCAEEIDDDAVDPIGNGDIVVDEPGVDALTCAGADGVFTADALDFVSLEDPSLYEDFGGAPDFTTSFDFDTDTFESTLTVGDEVTTTTGTFTVIGDQIVFSDPFVAGMADAPTALGCEFDGANLTVFGPTTYDYALDDGTDEFVDSDFTGTFTQSFGQDQGFSR